MKAGIGVKQPRMASSSKKGTPSTKAKGGKPVTNKRANKQN